MTEIPYADPMPRERTPSEAAILYYLQVRQLQGGGPATREEIKFALQLSDRTIDGALRKLREAGAVDKKEVWEALNVQKAQG